jgi:tetratricopeptide (TPR) repeat protein
MMTRRVVRPYPGRRSYSPEDIDFFFGRSKDAEELARLWQANPVTLAIGPTGSGKTSLLVAGTLPLVHYGRNEVLHLGRISYGTGYPLAALPEHNPFTLSLLRSWVPGEPVTRLVGLTVRDFIRRRARYHEGPILAAIDQAEDLLADSGLRGKHRREFLEDLAGAVREQPQLRLLLVIRSSAADEFARALDDAREYRLAALRPENALEAVSGPAELAGRPFAPGAAEDLLTDLRTSYINLTDGKERRAVAHAIHPALLQVVCAQLWDSLPPDLDVITSRDVRAYGDVDRLLADYCGRVIATVADEHRLKAARLRSWLIRMFVTSVGTCGTVYEGVVDTGGMPNAVLRGLEDSHLLSSERRSGTRWYRLASERLIEPLRHASADQPELVDTVGWLLAAERALTLGDLDLAARHGEEVLLTAPADDWTLRAEANSFLGNVAYERGKFAEAEGYYREAAGLFEAAQDTGAVAQEYAAVGQALLAQGRAGDAVSELGVAVRRLPNDYVVRSELAWAYWQRGEAGAAEAIFSDILAEDAGNAGALRGRGEILADVGRGREAMRDLSRTVPHDTPSTRAARGLALAELGDRLNALKEIEAALEQAPRNGPVLLYAARAEALGGDQAAAADLAEQAIYATDPPLPLHQYDAAVKLAGTREDDT